jgi:hypothetical protein
MAVTKIKPIKSTLKKALDYICNPKKTDEKILISSFGCSHETADIEFGFSLSQALNKGNNLSLCPFFTNSTMYPMSRRMYCNCFLMAV